MKKYITESDPIDFNEKKKTLFKNPFDVVRKITGLSTSSRNSNDKRLSFKDFVKTARSPIGTTPESKKGWDKVAYQLNTPEYQLTHEDLGELPKRKIGDYKWEHQTHRSDMGNRHFSVFDHTQRKVFVTSGSGTTQENWAAASNFAISHGATRNPGWRIVDTNDKFYDRYHEHVGKSKGIQYHHHFNVYGDVLQHPEKTVSKQKNIKDMFVDSNYNHDHLNLDSNTERYKEKRKSSKGWFK